MFVPANIFQPLIDVFEAVLKFFHNGGISWGMSIVLLTVCVRAVLLPLTIRQLRSMQKLQQLAPQLKAIQAKYKEDKQRQQQEIMKFYKENNVNPFASCLPLLLQLPVFIGLFYMLKSSLRPDICRQVQIAYRSHLVAHGMSVANAHGQTTYCTNPAYSHFYHGGAGFLFIPDLTNKASGWVLAVLIVAYVGTQLVSTLMMSAPTMDQNQRRLMMLLPLFFVILVINFPAGLILYWITTNTWTMGQQYVIRRTMAPVVPAAATGPPGSGGPGPGGPGKGGSGGSGGNGSGGDGNAPSNGAGSPSGLGATLRGLVKQTDAQDKTGVGAARPRRESAPPPPPRKKKKRSGRRR
jgi:YidC/Oxa1 family membrane protein insertase